MNYPRTLRLGFAVLTATLIAACAETSLPLSPNEGPLLSRGGKGGNAAEVQALRRHGRGGAETDQVLVTPDGGGTLSAGGVTLTVPPGAVDEPVLIELKVPNRRILFARFEPHGLQFNAPATLTFDLGGTDADAAGTLHGAYVGEGAFTALGRFDAVETFPAVVNGDKLSFDISHFSGYIVASGRSRQASF